jgi:RNA polymerase sigma-70 factor (ECF subfamily)
VRTVNPSRLEVMVLDSTDAELVTRVLTRGDETAFRALYRRHTPRLYRLQLRFAGGRVADAEDLVQDTWLRAVRRLDTFRSEGRFGAWLRGIAVNVAREWMRRTLPAAALHGDVDIALLADDSPAVPIDPDVERAINRLPVGQRAVFVLHDIEGFTHEEIARQLEIAAGTSKSQLSAARQTLRGALRPPHTDQEFVQ